MRIEESRVFVFQFDTTDMGGITFPMRANSREEAADQLQKCLMRIQSELAMDFPRIAVGTPPTSGIINTHINTQLNPVGATEGLAEVLMERIDKLMGDLGAPNLANEAKAQTIKGWTELEFTPDNYSKIVHELELLASGAKDVPVKKPKK